MMTRFWAHGAVTQLKRACVDFYHFDQKDITSLVSIEKIRLSGDSMIEIWITSRDH